MSVIARCVGGPSDGTELAIPVISGYLEVFARPEVVSTVPFVVNKRRGRYVRSEVIYRWAGWDDEGTVEDEQPSDPVGVGPLAGDGD